jgi:hypothetical protein
MAIIAVVVSKGSRKIYKFDQHDRTVSYWLYNKEKISTVHLARNYLDNDHLIIWTLMFFEIIWIPMSI